MGVFEVLKALFRHLGAFPAALGVVVVTVLFDTFFETALPLGLGWLIDHAVVPGRADLFLLPAALLAGGWVTSVAAQIGRDALLADLSARVQGRLRDGLTTWVSTVPFARIKTVRPAEWLAMHTADLVQIENLVLNVVPPLLFGLFYLIFGVVALVGTNPGLGTLVLAGLPLTLVGPLVLRAQGLRQGSAVREAEVEATSASQDLLAAQPLIRTFDLAEAFDRSLKAKTSSLLRFTRGFSFTGNLTRRLPNLTIHAVQLSIILVGTWMALHGQLKIGELLGFNLLFANVMTAVLDLASTLQPLLRAGNAFDRLASHSSPPGAQTPTKPRSDSAPLGRLTTGLRFDNVAFSYHPDRRTLDGVSFTIPAGKRTAIVGASGSGKSTLAVLLSGLYAPDRGHLFWDHLDLAQADRSSLLSRLGVVFQTNVIFDTSLRENILLGTPQAEERLHGAVEAAGLASWVRDLPEGLETRAGEGGAFLSGGQRQRLALARALVRQPDVLLLDEATSALDPLTEALVNDTLRSLPGTVVHITHRLAGIADYDHIVVLNDGRVVEAGPHEQLLEASGVYASLWNRQSGVVVGADTARLTPEGLKGFPLFADSKPVTLKALSASFVSESAEPGQRLIHQGRPGSRFFVVARGRVEVTKAGDEGERLLASLSDGEFFGEMSLLSSQPTSAHVTASQPSILLTLEKATFLTLLDQDEALKRTVTEMARQRLAQNIRPSTALREGESSRE